MAVLLVPITTRRRYGLIAEFANCHIEYELPPQFKRVCGRRYHGFHHRAVGMAFTEAFRRRWKSVYGKGLVLSRRLGETNGPQSVTAFRADR